MYQANCPNCEEWVDLKELYGRHICIKCDHIFVIPKIRECKEINICGSADVTAHYLVGT